MEAKTSGGGAWKSRRAQAREEKEGGAAEAPAPAEEGEGGQEPAGAPAAATSLVDQVAACNSALRDINRLLTWWESLSMIDRRSRHSRAHAVQTCENAILTAISSRTTAVSNSEDQGETTQAISGGDGAKK